jgi:hypothetical protein
MTPEDIRIAVAESAGWKWYRHPSANSLKHPHYRFLALPAAHEFEQSPHWMVAADMTEKPCSIEYMEKEFHLPNWPEDLNAVHELEKTLTHNERFQFYKELLSVGNRDASNGNDVKNSIHATALQRCEAYLRLKGLWQE